jgi:hypothetical protein
MQSPADLNIPEMVEFRALASREVARTPEFRYEVVEIGLNVEAGERDCHGAVAQLRTRFARCGRFVAW